MSKLGQIKQAVQQAAEAIASVLGVEVTIVDDTLKRIAGTGRYAKTLSADLAKDSVFAQVLRNGRGFIITDPGKHNACVTCQLREQCAELAQVCCPIKAEGVTIGVIALIAFSEQQRQMLLEQQNDLFGFINRMADLLASKVAEQENLNQLQAVKRQLETVINSVQEGIIAADRFGNIVNINTSAENMLGITADIVAGTNIEILLPGLAVEEVTQSGREILNQEIIRNCKGRRLHFLVTAKPWSEGGHVRGIVATVREMAEVRKFVSQLSAQNFYYTLDMILGESQPLSATKKAAKIACGSNATVLIQGESGTGKELFARAIHCGSGRKNKSFIAINCAAIPEALLESELFGYEEGAFTGARRGGKPGKFELADGGTLFLDEIGDMSLALQAKLLRVLQERRIERVGGVDNIPVDVRIVAATHKDIDTMVGNGEFRQDLYYRINVFPLYIPALRQRRDDLPLLIQTFLAKYSSALGKFVRAIDADAYETLFNYGWPGNVRELENVIEYLVNIATAETIGLPSIPARIREKAGNSSQYSDVVPLAQLERMAITGAIKKFGSTVEGKIKAAQALGISKATLYRKLKEYDTRFSI
ncbi:sigma 54-interacting transcriptional regulator [Sporomusa aerivorans]|uniref:sigma-54-dependent Fis family transcriptional regulator n=1 Tax=Sporomusa aerivorans TaxID=204936 RepID=UPI00352AA5F5